MDFLDWFDKARHEEPYVSRGITHEDIWNAAFQAGAEAVFAVNASEREYLRRGWWRYEIARRLSPAQWTDVWTLKQTTGKPFDEIIDDLRPFFCTDPTPADIRPTKPAPTHPDEDPT